MERISGRIYAETLSLKGALAALRGTQAAAREEIAQLKVQIDWLKTASSAPPAARRSGRAQLLLQFEGLEKLAARLAAPPQAAPAAWEKRGKGGRGAHEEPHASSCCPRQRLGWRPNPGAAWRVYFWPSP